LFESVRMDGRKEWMRVRRDFVIAQNLESSRQMWSGASLAAVEALDDMICHSVDVQRDSNFGYRVQHQLA